MADKHRYKIILLGDVGVGKTSLFNRITKDSFHDDCHGYDRPTIEADRFVKTMIVQGEQIRVSLWDTGTYGCETFGSLSNLRFFHKANGALLVYCVEDSYTFENLQKWIDDASKHVPTESFVWAMIGNKCDLPNEVKKIKVEQLCEQLQTKLFYLVSAKTGQNVSEAFQDVVTTIHNTQTHQQDPKPIDNNIQVPTKPDIMNNESGSCSCSCI